MEIGPMSKNSVPSLDVCFPFPLLAFAFLAIMPLTVPAIAGNSDLRLESTDPNKNLPLECPGDSQASQPPAQTTFLPGWSSQIDTLRTYDNFSGISGAITGIVWWGGGSALGEECIRDPDTFEIAFYTDNGNQPGSLMASESVLPISVATELNAGLGTIRRYEAALTTPVNLASGWVSVYATGFAPCYFYWANGTNGNGVASINGGTVNADFAFCLLAVEIEDDPLLECDEDSTVSQPPAQTTFHPGWSSEIDSLRSYDNFSGVSEPITGIVWWGGVNALGEECIRDPDTFEIAFYADNGNQPGTLFAAEDIAPASMVTSRNAGLGTLRRYEATFANPIDLSSGWVSVFGTGFAPCYFYWANGTNGNGTAYMSGAGTVGADFAFCLLTAPLNREADVAPRSDGDGALLANDWVQVGRFVAGLDLAAHGSEYQRADCAPYNTAGDGSILVNDWVQAGRYVAGLDAQQYQAGPIEPAKEAKSLSTGDLGDLPATGFNTSLLETVGGNQGQVSVLLDANGKENAVSFSLAFDPARFRFASATAGPDMQNAALILNTSAVQEGRLGVLIGLNFTAGEPATLAKKQHDILRVIFEFSGSHSPDAAPVFTDTPVRMAVSDAHAMSMPFIMTTPSAPPVIASHEHPSENTSGNPQGEGEEEPKENMQIFYGCRGCERSISPRNDFRSFLADYLLIGLSLTVLGVLYGLRK